MALETVTTDLKVTLINTEEVKNIFKNWGEFTSVCYNTKSKHPEKIAEHCKDSGHFSGSRADYFKFKIEHVGRNYCDQAVRHEVGVVKNVRSFRYVNEGNFEYDIPSEIKDSTELLNQYSIHMLNTMNLYNDIQAYVINKGKSKERANEQARHVLPMATHTEFSFALTIEALIHYMNMRLCSRTEDGHRRLAMAMRDVVLEVLPNLKDDLVPKCQSMLYCDEGKSSCGRMITKEQAKMIIDNYKINLN